MIHQNTKRNSFQRLRFPLFDPKVCRVDNSLHLLWCFSTNNFHIFHEYNSASCVKEKLSNILPRTRLYSYMTCCLGFPQRNCDLVPCVLLPISSTWTLRHRLSLGVVVFIGRLFSGSLRKNILLSFEKSNDLQSFVLRETNSFDMFFITGHITQTEEFEQIRDLFCLESW